jgi:GT2 family glycosyltransferase
MGEPSDEKVHSAPFVVAVILTYRRQELLRGTVAAVAAQTRPPDLVLVIDNDDQAGVALAGVSGVEIQVTGENLGPAGGYAVGFQSALERGADKIWVVDDDTVPDPSCLATLLGASRGVDVVVPLQRKPGRHQGFPPSWNGPLLDAAAVRAAGLPRSDLFFWVEDTEFFLRLRRAGIPVRRSSEAGILHLNPEDRRRGAARDWRLYYEVRNGLWYRLRAQPITVHRLARAVQLAVRPLCSILVLEPAKGPSLRLWWMAIRDVATDTLGKRVDPQTWSARHSSERR